LSYQIFGRRGLNEGGKLEDGEKRKVLVGKMQGDTKKLLTLEEKNRDSVSKKTGEKKESTGRAATLGAN